MTNDGYECVSIFTNHGWEWARNWKPFKDLAHFDKRS